MGDVADLWDRYQSIGLFVDANLLLLLVVGSCDPLLVARCERTSRYNSGDYRKLQDFVDLFNSLITTPNVLTEVSNLLGQEKGLRRDQYFEHLSAEIQTMSEEYIASLGVSTHPLFGQFGPTDLGIAQLARERFLVLTDDGPLANYLAQQQVDVLSFNML